MEDKYAKQIVKQLERLNNNLEKIRISHKEAREEMMDVVMIGSTGDYNDDKQSEK